MPAGLTALQALRDELDVAKGDRLFISGGAGGVGTMAIQIATWMGAEVATTASAAGDALVHRLGADRVIDYTREKFQDILHDYDAAFDLIGCSDLAAMFAIVKPGGTVVTIAGVPERTRANQDLDAGPLVSALLWLASARLRRQARRHGATYLFMHPSGEDLTFPGSAGRRAGS